MRLSREDKIAISLFFGLFFPLVLVINLMNKHSCDVQSVAFEDNQYSFIGGCMVKVDDMWINIKNIRVEVNTNE